MIASHNSQIRATLGFPRRTFIARVPCIEYGFRAPKQDPPEEILAELHGLLKSSAAI